MGKNNIPPHLCLKHRDSSSDISEPISIIKHLKKTFFGCATKHVGIFVP